MPDESATICRFKDELTALVRRDRSSCVPAARERLFSMLSRLERRALIGGASDRTLREIAEARFLAGILRESVGPVRAATLRTVRRALARPAGRGVGAESLDPAR